MIQLDHIEKGRAHQIRLNNFKLFGLFTDFVFDFTVIWLDIPALIWYFWLKFLVERGECGGDNGTFGIYMQLVMGIPFYVSLRLLKVLWHTPGNSYILVYLQKMGKWRKGCCSIFMHRVMTFFKKTMMELPLLIIAAVVLTLSKKYFFVAVLAATVIV